MSDSAIHDIIAPNNARLPSCTKVKAGSLSTCSGRVCPEKEGTMTQLLERPAGANFEWYLKNVVHSANKEGAALQGYADSLNSPGVNDNSLSYWIEDSVKHYLNTAKAKEDWSDVLRGKKKPEDVSSPQYCLDNLLVDSETVLSATVKNTEALSPAVEEGLRQELQRWSNPNISREKEIDNELREYAKRKEFAPAKLVSERLGHSESFLRRLARSGKLTRVKNKGLYSPASVFKYLEEKGRLVFW